MVVLVFRQRRDQVEIPESEIFDLPAFMLKNELADDLIGASLILVGSDAFAVERQRLRGLVDNCHSLIRKKLIREPKSLFLERFPLEEINMWMSVAFEQPHLDASVCCQRVTLKEETLIADPLGDAPLSSLAVLSPPRVSALRVPRPDLTYHRSTRHFVGLDETYSLVLFDSISGHLHWMLVDIPAAGLFDNAATSGITRAEYLPPIPPRVAHCGTALFVLFAQSSSLADAVSPFCRHRNCSDRANFRLEDFKQRHGLRVAAISWITSCYDLAYAFKQLQAVATPKRTSTTLLPPVKHSTYRRSKLAPSEPKKPTTAEVCAAFHIPTTGRRCAPSSSPLPSSLCSSILASLIIFLFAREL